MAYSLAIILDDRRLEAIKGTPLEEKIMGMYGGAIKALILEVSEEQSKKILSEFDKARIDARGFLEEVPIAFKRAVFEEIAKSKSLDVMDAVLNKLSEIKEAAKKESEYIPPPEI
jgi:hypothetical protein